ncbi:hypothetical protein TYRP_021272 [Tyrophagus putrescentiae]|nr:hypothetical protein TYRP_021272 [Tyrophagus putrescentiae]
MLFKPILFSASLALCLLFGLSNLHPANAQAGQTDPIECSNHIIDCGKNLKALKDIVEKKSAPKEATKEICCEVKTYTKCVNDVLAGDAKCKDFPKPSITVDGCDKFPTCGVSALTSLSVGFTLFIAICARVLFH